MSDYFVERCHLGFTPGAADFIQVEDERLRDSEGDDEVKENGPFTIKNTVDEGSLKINFDKKVRFGEQLAFKTGGVPDLFESELAKPIEFKNNFKTPQPQGKKAAKKP